MGDSGFVCVAFKEKMAINKAGMKPLAFTNSLCRPTACRAIGIDRPPMADEQGSDIAQLGVG